MYFKMKNIKKAIIRIGDRLMIPLLTLTIFSFIFDRELRGVPFITHIRGIILFLLIVSIIGDILFYFNNHSKKDKNKE